MEWQFFFLKAAKRVKYFNFSQFNVIVTAILSGNYYVKSAVRISQLISQKYIWGINYEIQGLSMACGSLCQEFLLLDPFPDLKDYSDSD